MQEKRHRENKGTHNSRTVSEMWTAVRGIQSRDDNKHSDDDEEDYMNHDDDDDYAWWWRWMMIVLHQVDWNDVRDLQSLRTQWPATTTQH